MQGEQKTMWRVCGDCQNLESRGPALTVCYFGGIDTIYPDVTDARAETCKHFEPRASRMVSRAGR